jgi:tRNA-2-methylthio-N6-dimethylallyladenosine synthase
MLNEKWTQYINDCRERGGGAPRFLTETMGCQMNERDSETIAGILSEMGCAPALSRRDADLIVVNTCSVRENADNRFFGVLGQLKKIKEERPDVIIAVCGCMMQQQHVVDAIKAKYSWVDIIFGTHNIHALPSLLQSAALEKVKAAEILDEGGEIVEGLPFRRAFRCKAYVTVMYGCDNYCAYCIVPYTRGRERSRRPDEILREVRALAADGVKEITLLGQNVNSYRGFGGEAPERGGGDGDGDGAATENSGAAAQRGGETTGRGVTDFPALIHMLNKVPGLQGIRFMTSHPKDLSDRLIAAYVSCEKLCRAIHLPVQSGSSRILALMNRGYTREDYLELIRKLRDAAPGIAVTTDIITGFPGETARDFEETLSLVEEVGFDSAFTFLYSPRRGTPAASYPDQVPEDVKHARFNRLVERLNAISAVKNSACLGRVETVLAEGPAKNGAGMLTGRTNSGKLVNFRASPAFIGELVKLRITETRTFSLLGELISDSS